MLSGDARLSGTADGEGEPARPSQEAPQVPVFDSMEDFPLEQSRDDTLRFAFDQVMRIDGHMVRPDTALTLSLRPLPLMEVPFERSSSCGLRNTISRCSAAAHHLCKECGTGTVPHFELLFGRTPGRVLDLVKESWEEGPSPSKNKV